MISIRTDGLYQAQESLQRNYLRLHTDLDELERICRRLHDCANVEECIRRLKLLCIDIEEEMQVFTQMVRALERACEYYPAAESSIVQEYEGMKTPQGTWQWGYSDLESIQDSLAGLALF